MRKLNFAMAGVAFIASMVVKRSSTMTPLTTVENFLAVAMFVFLIFLVIVFVFCCDESESKRKISLQQDGRYAIVGRYLRHTSLAILRFAMKEITVLLLDQMFSSTAIGPMEVFRHAGSLWNILTGMRCAPSSHVTTA